MEETPKMTPPIAKMHRQPRIVARTCASEQLALSFTIAAEKAATVNRNAKSLFSDPNRGQLPFRVAPNVTPFATYFCGTGDAILMNFGLFRCSVSSVIP